MFYGLVVHRVKIVCVGSSPRFVVLKSRTVFCHLGMYVTVWSGSTVAVLTMWGYTCTYR